MYYLHSRSGEIYPNLSSEEVNKLKSEIDWDFIGTMEGLEIQEKLKKLKKNERLK